MIQSALKEILGVDAVLRGVWNAETNTPKLRSGYGTKGDWYKISHNGFTVLDHTTRWQMGEVVYFNGTRWCGMTFGIKEPKWDSKATGNSKGMWDPVRNLPELKSGVGSVGDFYIVARHGYTSVDGTAVWHESDFIVFTQKGIWERKEKEEQAEAIL